MKEKRNVTESTLTINCQNKVSFILRNYFCANSKLDHFVVEMWGEVKFSFDLTYHYLTAVYKWMWTILAESSLDRKFHTIFMWFDNAAASIQRHFSKDFCDRIIIIIKSPYVKLFINNCKITFCSLLLVS